MIKTSQEVYEFVQYLIEVCQTRGQAEVAQQLDNAMHLGSSGMEALGAIRATLVGNARTLKHFVDMQRMQEVVEFVDTAFGR